MDSQTLMLKEIQDRVYVLDDRKLLRGLLSDCYVNDKAKVNQLLTAFDCGIVTKLLENKASDAFFKQRLIDEITNNFGYDKTTAKWIIDTWLFCISDKVIETYKKYKLESLIQESDTNVSSEVVKERETETVFLDDDDIPDGVFIPCGVGNDDNGFVVQGLNVAKECNVKYESFFAVIFNYLQRNSTIDEKTDKPNYIKQYEKRLTFEIDYRRIYRLMLIILLLVKNNYSKDGVVSFTFDGDNEEIKIAFLCLNNYLALLCRLAGENDIIKLKYQSNTNLNITFKNSSGEIKIIDYKGKKRNRIIWNARKIIYRITDQSKEDLEYILKEISQYHTFNAGQFEALKVMLSEQAHTVCIMPTGSGKSLIFYICSLLQPGVTFVISPTELLITDQIENLKKYHYIDDVKHLKYGGDDDFKNFIPTNKIYYLTPETFQNRDLLKEFILMNSDKKIANLVLDEVHCISNWSHDFRPEYLMLSTYLNNYLDRTFYKCFTATANYSVIKDIKNQLQIRDDRNIISPIKLEKNNIKFNFISCESISEMIETSIQFLKKNLIKGQKTLIFTKSDDVSKMLHESLDDIKYEAAVYKKSDTTAYRTFADGKCKILIASDELGIGINLSDVHNVLHFGLPISKGEFVQEIGRAGRNGESASSLVVYLKCNAKNVNERLLHRNTETSEIIKLIQQMQIQNDYVDTYRKIIGNIESQDEFMMLLYNIYNVVKPINNYEEIEFELDNIDKTKKCLFILFAIGYVNNWSFCDIDYKKRTIKMLIAVKKDNQTLDRIKETTRNYLYLLGGNKKSISLVGDASSVDEILDIYVDWYYNHFIYHHKEQFLDMLSFFESYKSDEKSANFSKEINNRLASYFSLSMLKISQDEAKYINLSYKNISETIIAGVDYNTVSNIQRINQDSNNVKLDYFLFVYSLVCDDEYDVSRLERILSSIDSDVYYDFIESLSMIYEKISIGYRLSLFKDMCDYINESNNDFVTFFDMIYRQNNKDLIYYGVMAKKINSLFGGQENV